MTRRVIHNGVSSPPSSTDADQHTGDGTPSTNLTMMSPDAGYQSFVGLSTNQNGLVRHPQGAGRPGRPALPAGMHYADPLRLATGTHLGHVMSPTANAFEPPPVAGRQVNTNFPAHLANRLPRLRVLPGLMPYPGVPTGLANLESVPVIQTRIPLRRCGHVQYGTFSIADGSYRAMEITNLYTANAYHRVQDLFAIHRFPSLREIDSRDSHNGTYRVSFYDSRDARQAFALARGQLSHNVSISWLPPRQYAMTTGRQHADLVSDREGEVIVSITPYNNTFMATFGHLFEALETCGDVKAVHSHVDEDRRVIAFRVEFYHAASAAAFQSNYDEETILDTLVEVINHEPDIRAVAAPVPQGASITGRTAMPQADMAEIAHRMPGLMAPRHRIGNNQVNVDRIQYGQDVRTTIMLRNIPNRVTQNDLKQYLDQTSRGQYDFMYLRIDFMNECNVGYAFINFIDPLAIVDFANVRAGKPWNMHESFKRAEISYATIQGRENLVQKFRNSSVMLENPAFRPKLYFAYPHPYAGNEEDFPKPDNLSKMKRSIENAEHIGLYSRNHTYHQPARIGYFTRSAHDGRQFLQHARGNPARLAVLPAQTPRLLLTADGDARRTNARFVDVNAANDPFAGRSRGPAQFH